MMLDGIFAVGEDIELHEEVETDNEIYDGREFCDHVNGGMLIKSKVIAARKLEMDFIKRLGV